MNHAALKGMRLMAERTGRKATIDPVEVTIRGHVLKMYEVRVEGRTLGRTITLEGAAELVRCEMGINLRRLA